MPRRRHYILCSSRFLFGTIGPRSRGVSLRCGRGAGVGSRDIRGRCGPVRCGTDPPRAWGAMHFGSPCHENEVANIRSFLGLRPDICNLDVVRGAPRQRLGASATRTWIGPPATPRGATRWSASAAAAAVWQRVQPRASNQGLVQPLHPSQPIGAAEDDPDRG